MRLAQKQDGQVTGQFHFVSGPIYIGRGTDCQVLLKSGETVSELSTGGLVLGFLEGAEFQEGHAQMSPGDVLTVYSDGVTDALNVRGEAFGRARLDSTLRRSLGETADGIADALVAAVEKHADGTDQTDDITLVVLKRLRT